ncbi:hypothetical protein L207DRAFT_424428 [Hyaloscypha variabilis F]|uniref:Uncharacterized protein n=1 Tax=Hyaloscypha variabilis (strain UAMH 11265 / GT02V1 / F) TaxID=1149755 RepID=A0A2J6RUD2_HYAVF|nr:hypothetical protein L207DRAFT_424428 [Hyaloscypha variabilis F]
MDLQTQFSSPKRKRNPPAISTIPPTPPSSSPPESSMLRTSSLPPSIVAEEEIYRAGGGGGSGAGSSSPRTKVAYNFQGLRLEDAGDVARLDLSGQRALPPLHVDDEAVVRKRVKILGNGRGRGLGGDGEVEVEIPETPDFAVVIGSERVSGAVDPVIGQMAEGVVLSNEVDPVIFRGSGGGQVAKLKGAGLQRAYPSINRLADSKSRTKKRAGTPPLGGKGEDGKEMMIVDEERAALTWHDDEITGHDPDDPDDDGEGINGIGFKPTPAEAYARAQKRRAQMAEYRNREARDARKMRSERRRGSDLAKASREEAETARRVRFMEAEAKSVIPTN